MTRETEYGAGEFKLESREHGGIADKQCGVVGKTVQGCRKIVGCAQTVIRIGASNLEKKLGVFEFFQRNPSYARIGITLGDGAQQLHFVLAEPAHGFGSHFGIAVLPLRSETIEQAHGQSRNFKILIKELSQGVCISGASPWSRRI